MNEYENKILIELLEIFYMLWTSFPLQQRKFYDICSMNKKTLWIFFCFDFDIYLFFCSFEFRLYFSELVKLLKVLLMCCLSTNSSHLVIGVRIVVVAYIRCCNSHTLSSKCHAMPVVNFINILPANFTYKSLFCSFFYLHVTREKLQKRRSYKKLVHKMLMKLTPCAISWFWIAATLVKGYLLLRGFTANI